MKFIVAFTAYLALHPGQTATLTSPYVMSEHSFATKEDCQLYYGYRAERMKGPIVTYFNERMKRNLEPRNVLGIKFVCLPSDEPMNIIKVNKRHESDV